MSVKVMSAIFETEFRDLTDEDGNVTKASTAKLVLLAMADHANDEGEGAYPSIETLCKKTALSAQTIRNTWDALRHNGVIELAGESKYHTNNHTINTRSFPRLRGEDDGILTLYPLDPSNRYLDPSNRSSEPLNRLDPNHQLTINRTMGASAPLKTDELPTMSIENQIFTNQKTVVLPDETHARRVDFANLVAMGTPNPPEAYMIAIAFQDRRDMTFPESKVKGQRKAIKEMLEMGVTAEHVRQAVGQLMDKGMTVADFYSVSKTAIDLANKPQKEKEYTRLL